MSERQTKTERRKNYEKEREKKFTDWKHIPCSVCSMDSFDFDCGCAATWSKRNKYWICDIQLLVSPLLDNAKLIVEAGIIAQKQFAQNVLSGLTEEEKNICI